MIKINLVAKRVPKEHLLIQKQFLSLTAATVASVIIVVMWVSAVLTIKADVQAELEKEKTEKQRLLIINAKSKKLKAKIKRRDEILKAIAVLEKQKAGPRPFMEFLNDILPSDIWLSRISNKGGSISVGGFSFAPQAVATLMRSMDGSKYFSKVELTEVRQLLVKGEKIKSFTVTAKLRKKQDDSFGKDAGKAKEDG